MHYSLLFYQSPSDFAARTDPQKRAEFWGSFLPYMKALRDAGVVVAGAGLQPPETATLKAVRKATLQMLSRCFKVSTFGSCGASAPLAIFSRQVMYW